MSARDWQLRLEDILEAIRNTQAYVRGMTFAEFAADLKTIRAAAYEIGIIGEGRQSHPCRGQDSACRGALGQDAGGAQRYRS